MNKIHRNAYYSLTEIMRQLGMISAKLEEKTYDVVANGATPSLMKVLDRNKYYHILVAMCRLRLIPWGTVAGVDEMIIERCYDLEINR